VSNIVRTLFNLNVSRVLLSDKCFSKDDFSPNFVENSVPVQQLLGDSADHQGGSHSSQTSDLSGEISDSRPPKRKKMVRSLIGNE
jgi:hypothetical protein